MKTYEMFNDAGVRSPIFQIENTYIALNTIVRILSGVDGVTEVRRCGRLSWRYEIKVEFKYLGRSFIVWEPFGDNSRYWIGPADMVEGVKDAPSLENPEDILNLENAFKLYPSWAFWKAIGDKCERKI